MGHAQPRSTCFWLLPQKWCKNFGNFAMGKMMISTDKPWDRGWGYFQTTPLEEFTHPAFCPLSHQFPAVCKSPRWCVPPWSVWFWLRCSKKWVFPNQLVRCGGDPCAKTLEMLCSQPRSTESILGLGGSKLPQSSHRFRLLDSTIQLLG